MSYSYSHCGTRLTERSTRKWMELWLNFLWRKHTEPFFRQSATSGMRRIPYGFEHKSDIKFNKLEKWTSAWIFRVITSVCCVGTEGERRRWRRRRRQWRGTCNMHIYYFFATLTLNYEYFIFIHMNIVNVFCMICLVEGFKKNERKLLTAKHATKNTEYRPA